MASLLKCPQRFTHEEWTFSNNVKYRSAEKEREFSQGLQNECDRYMDEAEKRTDRRSGIDLVHDDAQKELCKEVEVYKGVQALLQKTLEQTKEQLR
ncbi:hypothetical protein X801_06043 [Opisthorchis viverrini]|uniref:Tektin n=1 Tax=Opisthorchis viverrini TaxID=6198 RepID=A0A1S8WUM3_OPIVI|nr:hypothetical protein X801_06043 [Opisthorchis viverrini]